MTWSLFLPLSNYLCTMLFRREANPAQESDTKCDSSCSPHRRGHQASCKRVSDRQTVEITIFMLFICQVLTGPKRGGSEDGGCSHRGHHALRHVPRHRVCLLLPSQVPDDQRRVQQREEPHVGDHRRRLSAHPPADLPRRWVVNLFSLVLH